MDQQHLLVTLLTQDEGLIPQLMQKMNVNVNGLLQAAENEVKKLPRATGGQTYVSSDLENTDSSRKTGRKHDRRICIRRTYFHGNGEQP